MHFYALLNNCRVCKCASTVHFLVLRHSVYAQFMFSFLRCPAARIIFSTFFTKMRGFSRGGVPRNRPGCAKVKVGAPAVRRGVFFMDFGLLLGCPGRHFWRLFRNFSCRDAVGEPSVAIPRATFLATIFSRFRRVFFTNPRPPGGALCAFGLGRRGPNALRPFC